MKKQTVDGQTLVRYLLGEMSEDEQMALEEKYFGDARLFEQLQDAEDELIHRYVNNELAPPERRLFEQRLLTRPWQRGKVKLAQALKIYAAKEPKSEKTATVASYKKIAAWWRSFASKLALAWSYATAVVTMIFFSSWLFFETKDLRTQLTQFEAEQLAFRQREQELQQQAEAQREQNQALTEQLHNEQNRRTELESKLSQPQPPPLTLSLVPGTSRSSQATTQRNRLQIGPEAQLVRLQLNIESAETYESFRIILETAAGDTILTQYRLSAQQTAKGRALMILVPANMLSHEDYLITLQGVLPSREIEEIGYYSFSVMK
jgi:anti-sigma factor RsiW